MLLYISDLAYIMFAQDFYFMHDDLKCLCYGLCVLYLFQTIVLKRLRHRIL